jgi:glutathione S-transferase
MANVKIYGTMRSRASRCVWAAEEAGVAYELVSVDQSKGEQKTPEFLTINPNGHVPALRDGDLAMCESLAINLYLVKKARSDLGPKSLAEDALMTQWSMWTITEIEKHALDYLLHTMLFPADRRDPEVAAKALENLDQPLKVLDAALDAGKGHLVGGRFTIADLNAAAVVMWLGGAPKEFHAAYPNVAAWVSAAKQRPAHQKISGGR